MMMIIYTLLLSLFIRYQKGNCQQRTQICPRYHAKRTNNGKDHYCTCAFQVCPGNYVSIDGCHNVKGPQVLYVVNTAGIVFNSSLNFESPCKSGAVIENIRPLIYSEMCETLKVVEGCGGMKTCKGTVRIRISDSPIPAMNLFEHKSDKLRKHYSTKAPGTYYNVNDAGGDSSFGYCSVAQEFTMLEVFLISVVVIFAFVLCGLGILPLLCSTIISYMHRGRANRDNYIVSRERRRNRTPSVTQLSDDETENPCRQ